MKATEVLTQMTPATRNILRESAVDCHAWGRTEVTPGMILAKCFTGSSPARRILDSLGVTEDKIIKAIAIGGGTITSLTPCRPPCKVLPPFRGECETLLDVAIEHTKLLGVEEAGPLSLAYACLTWPALAEPLRVRVRDFHIGVCKELTTTPSAQGIMVEFKSKTDNNAIIRELLTKAEIEMFQHYHPGFTPSILGDKKFTQIAVDPALIGHTSNPEYEKLKGDKTMEALRDRTIKVEIPYDLGDGLTSGRLHSKHTHTHRVKTVCVAKDKVVTLAEGQRPCVRTSTSNYSIGNDDVVKICLSQNGERLACAGKNGALWVYDLSSLTTNCVAALYDARNYGEVSKIQFTPDGKKVVMGIGRSLAVWDFSRVSNQFMSTDFKSDVIEFATLDNTIAVATYNDTRIALVNLQTLVAAANFLDKGYATPYQMAYSPDERLLAVTSGDSIRIFNLGTLASHLLEAVADEYGRNIFTSLCFSPNGKRICTGGTDGRVRVFDVETGKQVCCSQEHRHTVNSVCWADERRIVSGSDDQSVCMLELVKPKPVVNSRLIDESITTWLDEFNKSNVSKLVKDIHRNDLTFSYRLAIIKYLGDQGSKAITSLDDLRKFASMPGAVSLLLVCQLQLIEAAKEAVTKIERSVLHTMFWSGATVTHPSPAESE